MPDQSYPFATLADADLHVDAIYEGGSGGGLGGEPLGKLLPVGLLGGFRISGSRNPWSVRMALLYSASDNPDWPDGLDRESGIYTYYGDNRSPGKEMHDTKRGGNDVLRRCFAALHADPPQRDLIPPFFVFEKATPGGGGRDVRFLGVAVPGARGVQPSEDLVAVWRSTGGLRFQNYRAIFTVLDIAVATRAWIDELKQGISTGPACPPGFKAFQTKGKYVPIEGLSTLHYRTVADQQPQSPLDAALVATIYEHFKDKPHQFEPCAVELWRMQTNETVVAQVTPMSADGGRDALGYLLLGPEADRIRLDFALEAKCNAPGNGLGVRATQRLISRLRHRQFGVLVTTSYVNKQAYEEIRSDKHPVVVICGRDIAAILRKHGLGSAAAVKGWLDANFAIKP